MNIRNTKELKSFAAQRLENARDQKRIVLIYAGITIGLSALVTIVNYVMGMEISQSGGLSNMGRRSFLSALQNMFPLVQSFLLLFLDVGYMAAMLRIARGQYASPRTLRLGFDRFWVLLRYSILKGLICFAIVFASVYIAIMIYMITPLSNSTMDLLIPLMGDASMLDTGLVLDDAAYAQLMTSMTPAFVLFGVVFCVLALPVMYQYRMAGYVIIDHPAMGAMAALRESKKMMKGNRFQLFRLDLSLWWYYAALAAASVVCYGDLILPLVGVEFPWSEDVSYFIFYALYLALQFAIYFFLRNRLEVAYGLAYDAVKPEEKKDSGVVLGNIFQM